MDRKFIYIIVILLTITLVTADYYMNRSLESVEYLNLIDDNNTSSSLSIEDNSQNNIENNDIAANPISYVTLTIINKQTNNNANLDYVYDIKIDSMSGISKYLKTDGKEEYQVFSANGETTLTLKSNETITFINIPLNSKYTITAHPKDDYKTYIDGAEKSTISGTLTQNSSFTFENVYNSPSSPVVPPTPTPPTPQKPDPNPQTSDYVIIPSIIALVLTVIIIINSRIKVKRFE